jgi:hypothetical protein
MNHSTQLKLTLPTEIMQFFQSKAKKHGIPVASYVRHILIKEIEKHDMPTFKASKWTENKHQQMLQDEKNGKLIPVEKLSEFLESL